MRLILMKNLMRMKILFIKNQTCITLVTLKGFSLCYYPLKSFSRNKNNVLLLGNPLFLKINYSVKHMSALLIC